MISNKFLEEFYENVVLPKYSKSFYTSNINWLSHERIDESYAFAHYFKCNEKEYALLYEDFPGDTYLKNGAPYEIIKCGDKTIIQLCSSDNKEIDNVLGWFALYREKSGI